MTRVYVPYSLNALGELVGTARVLREMGDDDDVSVPVSDGHAVTEELRRALPQLDDEALEHYAMTEAAQESLSHVSSDFGRDRRLVAAVDAPDVVSRPGELTRVEVRGVDMPTDVAAWLVDADEAVEAVAAAAGAIRMGQEQADELAERCLDHELAWYAATEVDDVLGLS